MMLSEIDGILKLWHFSFIYRNFIALISYYILSWDIWCYGQLPAITLFYLNW